MEFVAGLVLGAALTLTAFRYMNADRSSRAHHTLRDNAAVGENFPERFVKSSVG